ncbi:hypothetical protein AAMO2058_000376000 [Amorphochlora amoebiformis]
MLGGVMDVHSWTGEMENLDKVDVDTCQQTGVERSENGIPHPAKYMASLLGGAGEIGTLEAGGLFLQILMISPSIVMGSLMVNYAIETSKSNCSSVLVDIWTAGGVLYLTVATLLGITYMGLAFGVKSILVACGCILVPATFGCLSCLIALSVVLFGDDNLCAEKPSLVDEGKIFLTIVWVLTGLTLLCNMCGNSAPKE